MIPHRHVLLRLFLAALVGLGLVAGQLPISADHGKPGKGPQFAPRVYERPAPRSQPGVQPSSSFDGGGPAIQCQDDPLVAAKIDSQTIYADQFDRCTGAMAQLHIELELRIWSSWTGQYELVASHYPTCYGCSQLLAQIYRSGLPAGEYMITAKIWEYAPPGYSPSGWISPTKTAFIFLP